MKKIVVFLFVIFCINNTFANLANDPFNFPEYSNRMAPSAKNVRCEADCWAASCSASGIKCICGCTYLGLSCSCSVVVQTQNTPKPNVKFTKEQYENIKGFARFLYDSNDKEFYSIYQNLSELVASSKNDNSKKYTKNFNEFKNTIDNMPQDRRNLINNYLTSHNAPTL